MDLIDRLHAIGSRAAHADQLATEEATKMALVIPFFQALGYDVYDPFEVVPEFTADVGTKKGEKVDYAIMRDGQPIILVECKKVGVDLNRSPASQLFRYFTVTPARVGVLTDGIVYKFFSDLEAHNKMDERPFLEFDIRAVDDNLAGELKRFAKQSFDIDSLLAAAEEMKYTRAIRKILAAEFANPSEELVRHLTRQVHSGSFTKSVKEKFDGIVKRAMREFINDRIDHRLHVARDLEERDVVVAAGVGETPSEPASALPDGVISVDGDVVTTTEELEAFLIVKAIARSVVDVDRIHMRDTKSYCGVLLDDNNRKPICRLRFNSASRKYLGVFDAEKNETKVLIESISDIYDHADGLVQAIRSYLEAEA